MKKPKVCILRAAGTNCDRETAFAFLKVGAAVESIHINKLVLERDGLSKYHILAIPGGFTYGDDVAAGRIFANELRFKLSGAIKQFISQGRLIIGICNGFQILVKSGLLPGGSDLKQNTSLIINDSAKFEDRWVYLRRSGNSVWVKDLPEVIYLPVAHGEGKFITGKEYSLKQLRENRQIIFRYCDEKGNFLGYPYNPNGSVDNIAGICDKTGRVFGLMPHPERHASHLQHPRWLRGKRVREPDGLLIFRNGVEYARKLC